MEIGRGKRPPTQKFGENFDRRLLCCHFFLDRLCIQIETAVSDLGLPNFLDTIESFDCERTMANESLCIE